MKAQKEFLNSYDIQLVETKKNAELKQVNQLIPELFQEFDLIPQYEHQEEDANSHEGHFLKPYKTKEPSLNLSENNS